MRRNHVGNGLSTNVRQPFNKERWAESGDTWALHRLLWAVPAGLLAGYGLGKGVSRLAILLRCRNPDSVATGDFLALALIALSYAGAEYIGAW